MAERIALDDTPAVHMGSCCSHFDVKSLARQILNVEDLETHASTVPNVYTWRMDNKYYSADVRLCIVAGVPGAIGEMQNCEAILLYIDATDRVTFKRAVEKSWQQLVKDSVIPVRMLLCQSLDGPNVTADFKEEVQAWCCGHQFEVIELDPFREGSMDGDDDADSDYGELFGVQRIIEALNAHTWPNMRLKEHKLIAKTSFTDQDEPPPSNVPIQTEAGKINPSPVRSAAGLEGGATGGAAATERDGLLTEEDGQSGQLFEHMFAKLNMMNERAAEMPNKERKQFAEDVVISFWKAIHGDSAELPLDLSDSEDEDDE